MSVQEIFTYECGIIQVKPTNGLLAMRAGHQHNVGGDPNAIALDGVNNPAFVPALLEIEKQM